MFLFLCSSMKAMFGRTMIKNTGSEHDQKIWAQWVPRAWHKSCMQKSKDEELATGQL